MKLKLHHLSILLIGFIPVVTFGNNSDSFSSKIFSYKPGTTQSTSTDSKPSEKKKDDKQDDSISNQPGKQKFLTTNLFKNDTYENFNPPEDSITPILEPMKDYLGPQS